MQEVALPIVVAREGKWYVASCPLLDLATQGKTLEEAKRSMQALIKEYLRDPDTRKPNLKQLLALSLTTVPVRI